MSERMFKYFFERYCIANIHDFKFYFRTLDALQQCVISFNSTVRFTVCKFNDLWTQRPLTRYLPIKSESLDLRHHIETAGHQLPLIHDVTVDTTSCSGYLSKMSKKFHHWNKRWFVFDRKRKTLSYYSDSTSRKARGVIYFQVHNA